MSFDPKQYAELAEAFLKKPVLKWFFITLSIALLGLCAVYRWITGEDSTFLLTSAFLALAIGIAATVIAVINRITISRRVKREADKIAKQLLDAEQRQKALDAHFEKKVRSFNQTQAYLACKTIQQNHKYLVELISVKDDDFQKLLEWGLAESTGLNMAKWDDEFWDWLISDRARLNTLLDEVAVGLKLKSAKQLIERIDNKRAAAKAQRKPRRFIDLRN